MSVRRRGARMRGLHRTCSIARLAPRLSKEAFRRAICCLARPPRVHLCVCTSSGTLSSSVESACDALKMPVRSLGEVSRLRWEAEHLVAHVLRRALRFARFPRRGRQDAVANFATPSSVQKATQRIRDGKLHRSYTGRVF